MEELPGLVVLLDHLQQIGEAEQHLVHALVLGVLGCLYIVLDRLIGPFLGVLLGFLLLIFQLGRKRRVLLLFSLEDLLIEAARLQAVGALIFGVKFAEPEVEVSLLGVIVGRNLDEPIELFDLLLGDLLNLRLLLPDELFHRQNRPSLFLLFGRLLRFRQLGLRRRLDFQFFLLELRISESCT